MMNIDIKFDEADEKFGVEFEENIEAIDASFSDAVTIHGKDGDSAYQIALNNGFVGTEKEWLGSLRGNDGKPGKDGKTPIKGTDYFTEADKHEVVLAVLAAIPVYGGEVE